ncbi:twin-arginine translocase subunit TatC [Cohnella nanjingensis]|uniref:Sec-independent protein translocase protein TatC n=2 Tax=Cohnella nanjingensis TaxID=1387779 RepID=A0A7X0RY28_9BACL|nr:twin-arginine translocase subunit TatC [Cohnella nanjingensis]
MTLVGHLTDLRRRILFTLAALIVGVAAGLACAQSLIAWMKSVPPADQLAWNIFSPGDAVRLYLNVGFISGVVISLPFSMYQLWLFLKPGLAEEERRVSFMFIPAALLLFVAGLAFGYFVVFRMALLFTSAVAHRLELTETYGIMQYFSFLFNITIPIALMFELPVVVLFLTKLRILKPRMLRRFRRYAYMALVIVAGVITPPDAVSMLLVYAPMIVLYEGSVLLSSRMEAKSLPSE